MKCKLAEPLVERGGFHVDVVMEMPSDTHTHTSVYVHMCVCGFACSHVAGWMDWSRGERGI